MKCLCCQGKNTADVLGLCIPHAAALQYRSHTTFTWLAAQSLHETFFEGKMLSFHFHGKMRNELAVGPSLDLSTQDEADNLPGPHCHESDAHSLSVKSETRDKIHLGST